MTVYLLPTSTNRGYRGKYPSRIRSVSYSPSSRDAAGDRCIHVETNYGDRLTISLDRLADKSGTWFGKRLTSILHVNTVIETMDQTTYDAWLSRIRKERG